MFDWGEHADLDDASSGEQASAVVFFIALVLSATSYVVVETCQTLYDDGALDTSVRPLVDYFLDTASDGSRTPSPLAGIARAVGSLSGSTTPRPHSRQNSHAPSTVAPSDSRSRAASSAAASDPAHDHDAQAHARARSPTPEIRVEPPSATSRHARSPSPAPSLTSMLGIAALLGTDTVDTKRLSRSSASSGVSSSSKMPDMAALAPSAAANTVHGQRGRPSTTSSVRSASDSAAGRSPSPAASRVSRAPTPEDPRSPIDAAIETAVLAFDALTPNLDSLAPTSLDATSAMTSSATIVSSPSPSPLPNGTSKAVSILPSQASLAVATVSAGTAVEPHRDAKPALFRKKPVPPPSPSAVRLAKARSLRPETVVDEMYPVVALPLRVVDAAWDKSVDITAGVLSMCFAPVRTTRMLVRRGTGW
ncbi:hypothetical protein HK105_203536 [Polyrhizophydium stewartii]|uniref:Uncharacterized protein n=1 Tax=Polyrhizophydium stewartii TaxID=2732419 RepID=A0ABR4NB94_9FUNG